MSDAVALPYAYVPEPRVRPLQQEVRRMKEYDPWCQRVIFEGDPGAGQTDVMCDDCALKWLRGEI